MEGRIFTNLYAVDTYFKRNIKRFLSRIPKEPGIYKFLDARKLPIYIGKAKNLKNRVPSYFQDSKDKTKKLRI